MSANDPRLHFGLGPSDRVEEVEVRWPSGRTDRWTSLPAGTGYSLREGDPTPRPLAGIRPTRRELRSTEAGSDPHTPTLVPEERRTARDRLLHLVQSAHRHARGGESRHREPGEQARTRRHRDRALKSHRAGMRWRRPSGRPGPRRRRPGARRPWRGRRSPYHHARFRMPLPPRLRCRRRSPIWVTIPRIRSLVSGLKSL